MTVIATTACTGSLAPSVTENVSESAPWKSGAGVYVRLGSLPLRPGSHRVGLHFGGSDLHPGSGGGGLPIGPLVLSRSDASRDRISYFDPAEARRLCGRSWDWIEVLNPGPVESP